LDDSEIDSVVIATRHDAHAPLTTQALRAGKNVFVEKPLAILDKDIDEIENILLQAGDQAPRLMIGFNRRFSPTAIKMKSLLDNVKQPKCLIATINAGALPANHWAHDPMQGGGRIIGEGCHFIDLLRFFIGAPITDVQTTQISLPTSDGIKNDKVTITLSFEDGSIGTVHYFANGPKTLMKERYEAFVADRYLRLENFKKLVAMGWTKNASLNGKQDKGHAAALAAFIHAVQKGEPSPIPPEDLDTLRTVPRLGLQNILRIVNYRLSLKNPYSAIRRVAKTGATITGPIFNIAAPDHSPPSPAQSARTYRDLEGTSGFTLPKAFGYHPVDTPQTTPDWFRNPLTRAEFKNPQRPFYEISDFDPDVGDIKQIWELSRKGWALDMARQAKHNPPLYPQLNDWISDWVRQNPAYEGPNWKCGQEASIRVMHLMVTGHLLGQLHSPTSGFLDYLKLHLRRIVPTISYAIAQDNNHGTSEAAALYMGGQYLVLHGENQGRHWSRLGRR